MRHGDVEGRPSGPQVTEATRESAEAPPGDFHVLLVDDHAPVLRFLTAVLAASGCQIFTASTADEAIGLVSTRAFDLVVTDIHMPGLSGLEVLTAVKDRRPETPVVLLTGQPSVESAVFGVRHQAYDYLAKPVTASDVRDLLERVKRDREQREDRRRSASPEDATESAVWRLRLGIVTRLGDLAAEAGDTAGFLDDALREILTSVPCEAALVLLSDPEGTLLTHRVGNPALAAELLALSEPLLEQGPPPGSVAPLVGGASSPAGLAAALPSTGRRRGLLALGRRRDRAFQPAETDLVLAFARMTGLALMKLLLRESLEENLVDTISSFLVALESKDAYLKGHSARVSLYAGEIARAMGLPPAQTALARRAAMLHDLGKLVMFDSILLKPGRLSTEEFALMKAHPLVAAKILKPLRFLSEEADALKAHHERYDGTGYPDGLKGEAIPLAGRIITVADSLDAMTSDRPYRRALPLATAVQEILRHQGTQFDPAVAQALASIPMERLTEISRFQAQTQAPLDAPTAQAGAALLGSPGGGEDRDVPGADRPGDADCGIADLAAEWADMLARHEPGRDRLPAGRGENHVASHPDR
jgi:putative nucleotidyltransferase with HDIG domain